MSGELGAGPSWVQGMSLPKTVSPLALLQRPSAVPPAQLCQIMACISTPTASCHCTRHPRPGSIGVDEQHEEHRPGQLGQGPGQRRGRAAGWQRLHSAVMRRPEYGRSARGAGRPPPLLSQWRNGTTAVGLACLIVVGVYALMQGGRSGAQSCCLCSQSTEARAPQLARCTSRVCCCNGLRRRNRRVCRPAAGLHAAVAVVRRRGDTSRARAAQAL